jgi:dihydroorotase-like cyclic amidohydrolase
MKKLINKSLLKVVKFHNSYLLKNARIVNADFTHHGDVLIQDGKVAEMSSNITNKKA